MNHERNWFSLCPWWPEVCSLHCQHESQLHTEVRVVMSLRQIRFELPSETRMAPKKSGGFSRCVLFLTRLPSRVGDMRSYVASNHAFWRLIVRLICFIHAHFLQMKGLNDCFTARMGHEVLFLPASASSSGEDCAYLQIARDAQGGNYVQGCLHVQLTSWWLFRVI